jgi:alkanesulfonate monooxygenase SsuD/methylene tetrahydromethanopterin reductase-like flavin-dependent oxidoreductase (luciferase family)
VFLNVNVHPRQATAVDDALAAWSHQSTRNVSAEQLREISAIGSPAQAADTIGRLVEAGATAFIFELLSERRHEQLELITEHLLPLLS